MYERPFLPAPVIFKLISRCGQFVVVRQHHTALTARDRLVAVVRQNAHLPERSDVLAIKPHTDAFGSVFDYFQSMLAGKGHHRGHVGALSVKMNRHHRASPVRHQRFRLLHVDTKCVFPDLAEHRFGPR